MPHRTIVQQLSLAVIIGILGPAGAQAQDPAPVPAVIAGAEAREYVGSLATVCGTVASARYDTAADGQPTFLNLDEPYPNQSLVVVIPGRYRSLFGQPETELLDREICATGQIEELTPPGLLRIVITERGRLTVVAQDER